MAYYITDKDLYISKAKLKNLNIFWLGFLLYTLGYELGCTIVYLNIVQMQLIQFTGIMLLFYGAVNLLQFNIKNGYLKAVYSIYLLWLLWVISRGFNFDVSAVKESLVNPGYGIFIYLTPLFLLMPVNFAYYRKLFQVIFILSIMYFGLSLVFIKDIFNSDRQSLLSQGIVENFTMMSFCSAFTLLTYLYHNKWRKLFAFAAMGVMLLCAIYRARRGLIMMTVTNMLCVLIVYLIVTKRVAMVVFMILVIAVVGYFYYSSIYNQKNFGIFNFLIERSDEDTRSGVEIAMKEDMTTTDWIIGKGINGEYYCPNIDVLDERGYRSVMETGYLEISLKGGIGSLVLMGLIFIPAIVRGFGAKNILGIAASISILLWILFLVPTVCDQFAMTYIIVWLSVGICFSPKILNMTDAEVAAALEEPKKVSGPKSINRFTPQDI
jgi:hypothetical protein